MQLRISLRLTIPGHALMIFAACVLATTAGSITFASASHAYGLNFQDPLLLAEPAQPLPASTGLPASESPQLGSEMAVLTRQGITPARARQALRLQQQVGVANLSGKIEAALGRAYAGTWLEPSAAKYHVGVTSHASARTVKQLAAEAGVTADLIETPVRSTWNALIKTQEQWNKRLARLLANGQATTGLDAQHNAVSVKLSSSVSPADRALLERAAAAESVTVLVTATTRPTLDIARKAKKTCTAPFKTEKTYCEETITSGTRTLTAGALECTAGPFLISANQTYMLTAGHCFANLATTLPAGAAITEQVTSAFPNVVGQKEIGSDGYRYNLLARDTAEVKVKPGGPFTQALPDPVPALMAEWVESPLTPAPVAGLLAAEKGQTVCHEGASSGENCGEVEMLDATGAGTEHVVEVSACSNEGDSGGPYFTRTEAGGILMLGTEIGGPPPDCIELGGFYESFFEPLLSLAGFPTLGILATFPGQRLLTTANEVRPESTPLPDIHTALPGDAYPLYLGGEAKAEGGEEKSIALANTNGLLPATSVSLLLTVSALTSLGAISVDFAGVHEKEGTKCNTTGDAAGVVLVPSGEFHLVYAGLSPTSTLEAALLVLFTKFVILCGALETAVESPMMSRITERPEEGDQTSIEVNAHCSNITNGTQELSMYYNDSLALLEKQLLKANISGSGAVNACQEIKPSLLLSIETGSAASMFSILL